MSAQLRSAQPTGLLEQLLFLGLLKAADALSQEAEQLTRGANLTGTQYNVLRILRGAGPEGLACRSVGERMITHDPDITRLLDRMEERGLISRERQKDDRRVVKARITQKGLGVLKPLDQPMRELHRRQFRHMTGSQQKILYALLNEIQSEKQE